MDYEKGRQIFHKMQILKYLFLVLALVVVLAPATPVVNAECTAIRSDGGLTPGACENNVCPPPPVTGTLPCAPTTASGLIGVINKVFTTMFIFLVTIASFTLLYAAFLYVTSEGEQEKINQAKKIIIYAVIALIVAALAFGAPRAIQSFITT